MATTTSESAAGLAKGLYQVLSAGVKDTEDAADAMGLLDVAQQAAVAGMSDTFSAVDVLTTSLNAYGVSASEASRFSDLLFASVKAGKITFNDFAAGLGLVASGAAGAGIEFKEITGAMATLTKAGVLLRKEGLLGVMQRLQKVTEGDATALRELVKEQEAFVGLSVLAGTGAESFNEIMEKMGQSTGATDEAFQKMTKTFEFQKKQFWNVLNELLIKIGEKLMPVVLEALDDLSKWVSENEEGIVMFFGGVIEAIKAVIGFIKDVLELLGKLSMSLSNTIKDAVAKAQGQIRTAADEWNKYYSVVDRNLRIGVAEAAEAGAKAVRKSMGQAMAEAAGAVGIALGGETGKKGKPTKEQIEKWRRERESAEKTLQGMRIQNAEGLAQIEMNRTHEIEDARRRMRILGEEKVAEAVNLINEKFNLQRGKLREKQLAEEEKAYKRFLQGVKEEEKIAADILKYEEDKAAFVDKAVEDYHAMRNDWMEMAAAKWAVSEPTLLQKIGEHIKEGFLERLGEKLYDLAGRMGDALFAPLTQLSGVLMAPLDQISALMGGAFAGQGIEPLQEMLDGFLTFWENLGENLGPVLEWLANEALPALIEAFVENFPAIVDAVVQWGPVIVSKIVGAIPVIAGQVIAAIPEIVQAFIDSIPIIIQEFIKSIPQLAIEVGKAIAQAFKNIITGRWGEETSWLKGEEGILPDEIPILGKLHEGGMVRDGISTFAGSVTSFMNAVRAHSGMYVKPGLTHDEVPIVAQIGEAVLNRGAVSRIGGEAGVNALNRGGRVGAETHVTNNVYTQYLLGKDVREVVDGLMGESMRMSTGKVYRAVEGKEIPGFKSRRR
jgi:hypothetical protein